MHVNLKKNLKKVNSTYTTFCIFTCVWNRQSHVFALSFFLLKETVMHKNMTLHKSRQALRIAATEKNNMSAKDKGLILKLKDGKKRVYGL